MRRLVALSLGALFLITACTRCGGSSTGTTGGTGGTGATADDYKHFFLPTVTGDNTSAPVLALDGSGGLHSAYPAFSKGGAYYTYCANGCASATDVSYVHFTTNETVLNAMLALNSSGKPRVLMNTGSQVYYASCDSGCTDLKGWTVTSIIQHNGKKEVSGRGFTLDPTSGQPRFILHTTVTYLGIGQGDPLTEYMTCDGSCNSPSSWKSLVVDDQYIWYRPELRIDTQGHIHVAASLALPDTSGGTTNTASYIECTDNCTQAASWKGTKLIAAYASETEAITIKPTVSLALTSSGTPRIAVLAQSGSDKKLAYLGCDSGCTTETSWTLQVVTSGSSLGDGLDLVLDPQDHPRLAFTSNYNIVLGTCDAAQCATTDSKWSPNVIEDSGKMKPDEIFLYTNCNASAWFLHAPSLVLTKSGGVRVGYQARDVSGGWVKQDPKGPDCVAGTDMTWSRLAVLN